MAKKNISNSTGTHNSFNWIQNNTGNIKLNKIHYCTEPNHYITKPNWNICEICNCRIIDR
jgi:hypothetical protein